MRYLDAALVQALLRGRPYAGTLATTRGNGSASGWASPLLSDDLFYSRGGYAAGSGSGYAAASGSAAAGDANRGRWGDPHLGEPSWGEARRVMPR